MTNIRDNTNIDPIKEKITFELKIAKFVEFKSNKPYADRTAKFTVFEFIMLAMP